MNENNQTDTSDCSVFFLLLLRVSTSRGKVRSQRNYFIALISFDPKRGSAFPKKRP